METNKAAPPFSPPPAPPKPTATGSPVRLMVLLGLLLVVVGAYAYDFLVLKPGVKSGYDKIQNLVDERNKLGVQKGKLVTSADVQQLLGRKPNFTKDDDKLEYTIEYYCWWGSVPVINRRRHYIAVVYTGKQPRHFSSHYQEEPPPEALPIIPEAPKDTGKATTDGDGKLPPPNGVEGGGKEPPAKTPDAPAKAPDATDKPATTEPPAADKPAADSAKPEKAKENP